MKTLTFLTLFLGLVWGDPWVELAAVDGTQQVELRVDGELVAVIQGGPPWKARLDLGGELAPHLLEAVALDAEGQVTGRAEQWINLARSLDEVHLFLDAPGLEDGRSASGSAPPVEGAVARVVWNSVRHSRAASVEVTLDGQALPVATLDSIPLPPFDPGEVHVLSARVVFPDDSSARADLAFGGPYGEEVTTELSGVPVLVDDRRKVHEPSEAGDWLRRDGRSLPVVAVDHGAADFYAVFDEGADYQRLAVLVGLSQRMGSRNARLVRFADPETGEPRFEALGVSPGRKGNFYRLGMRAGDRLFLVRPRLEERDDHLRLFPLSRALHNDRGGTAWQVAYYDLGAGPEGPQQLADAVATIGLWATGRNRPRAVVLVLGPHAQDESRLEPAAVRRYLDRLGVPLSVLYVEIERPPDADGGRSQPREERLAAARARWGDDVVDVAEVTDWLRFFDELRQDLDRQRILWVRGRHVPEEVDLAPSAPPWLSRLGAGTD